MRNVSPSLAKIASSAILIAASGLGLQTTAVAGTTKVDEVTNGVQYSSYVTFAQNSQSAVDVTVLPATATGKILEVKSISLYRYPSTNSTLQCFLAVPATTIQGSNTVGFVALPDIYPSSDYYPATTLALTVYVPAGKQAYVNCYRTGGASYPAETVYFTVVGDLTSP